MRRAVCWCGHEQHGQGCNSCRYALVRLFQWQHRFQPIRTLPIRTLGLKWLR